MKTREEVRRDYRQRQISKYLAIHGSAPLCACGCGKTVTFDNNGKPNVWISQHHHRSDDVEVANRARLMDNIDADLFRKALRKIKEDRGVSWGELAAAGGISRDHISTLMYGRQKTVSRAWARDFLTRVAGGAAPPSTYHKNQLALAKKARREVTRMYEDTLAD